jgi:hypothetical protein
VIWGARPTRRWPGPGSARLALPALWYGGLSIMLATLPLLGARSWTELRAVVARGRTELAAEIERLPRPFGRPSAPVG